MRAVTLILASALAFGAGAALAETQAFWPAEADSNNDDMISRDEAMILSEAKFAEYDRDGGGDISMTEWRMAIDDQMAAARERDPAASGPADLEGFAAKTFATHDADNDGVISRGEWDARVEAHFARLDQNGDGMIERDEAAGTEQGQKKGD
jgi:hypothetical protein